MRRAILAGLLCWMLTGSVWAQDIQDIVVNEYQNGGAGEYVELLVLTDKLDLRGYQVRDFVSSSGASAGTITFLNNALWAQVRRGYIIVIDVGEGSSSDVDFGDGVVTVGEDDMTYFESVGSFIIGADKDGVEVLNAGNSHVHMLYHGSPQGGSDFETAAAMTPGGQTPSGSLANPGLARFYNTDEVADFNNDANVEKSTTATKGDPNDATQAAFRAKLLPLWISEVSTNQGTSDLVEFIEIAGPEGFVLSGYRIQVYTCLAGTASLDYTETVGGFTFADDFSQFGYFVLGAPTVLNQNQDFTGDNFDRLSDTGGIIVLLEPTPGTNELFDYKFGIGCSLDATDGRTTRSLADDALPVTAMGFTSVSKPADTATGSSLLEASPGAPNENVLPVELVAFEAVADGEALRLYWETASETNNAGFELQQRADAQQWEALAFIEGQGTTTQVQTYAHRIDRLLPGIHRFRLKQIDYDGTFAYSPEVEVAIGVPGTYHFTSAYPNPFNPETSFSLSVARAQQVQVAVFDVVGRRVALLYDGTFPGETARAFRFEAGSLPSGVYLLRVQGEQFVTTQPLVLAK